MINVPDDVPFDSVNDLGIAIRTIPGGPRLQLHIGFLYKIENEESQILNLRHYSDLRNEVPTNAGKRWKQEGIL